MADCLDAGTRERLDALLADVGRGTDFAQLAAELGRAAKTVFLCRYLGAAALRREIHEGLNVVETWNSANDFIFFGEAGEMASNRLEDQEVSVHALHVL